MKGKIPRIELYSWARCPKCGYSFLLDEETNPITERDELPPSILSVLSGSAVSGNPSQGSGLNYRLSEDHKGIHNQGIQLPDQLKSMRKVNEADNRIEGKEQPHKGNQEDL